MADHPPQHARGATDVDVRLGRRLRQRRKELGLSQHDLAGRLGISYQQLQKYEKGTNRIAVSRLMIVAAALDTPVAWFLPPARYPDAHEASGTGSPPPCGEGSGVGG